MPSQGMERGMQFIVQAPGESRKEMVPLPCAPGPMQTWGMWESGLGVPLPWKMILVRSRGATAVLARAPASAPDNRELRTCRWSLWKEIGREQGLRPWGQWPCLPGTALQPYGHLTWSSEKVGAASLPLTLALGNHRGGT